MRSAEVINARVLSGAASMDIVFSWLIDEGKATSQTVVIAAVR